MAELDPFTQVYDALWDLLEAHPGFAHRVKLGNRIKFTGQRANPMKEVVQAADLPEVRLVIAAGTNHLQRTSSSSYAMKTFEIQISTGEQGMDAALFPVEWEIYRAMSKWASVLAALTWKSKTFVKLAKLSATREGTLESDIVRNIKGWAAVWSCEVHMWFVTSDLE